MNDTVTPFAELKSNYDDEVERLGLVQELAQELGVPILVDTRFFAKPPVSWEGGLTCYVVMERHTRWFRSRWFPCGVFSNSTQAYNYIHSLPLPKKPRYFILHNSYDGKFSSPESDSVRILYPDGELKRAD